MLKVVALEDTTTIRDHDDTLLASPGRRTGPTAFGSSVALLALLLVAATVPFSVPDGGGALPLWVVGATAVPFLTMRSSRLGRLWVRVGSAYGALWLAVLVAATGGIASPYAYLFAVLLVLSAVNHSQRQLVVVGVLSVAGTLSTALYDPRFDAEVVVDVAFQGLFVFLMAFTTQHLVRRLVVSEERFRLLAENAQDVVYRMELRPSLSLAYVSPAVETLTGYTTDEFHSDPELWLKLVHPEDRSRVLEAFANPPRRPRASLNMRIQHRDGSTRCVEDRLSTVTGEDGTPAAIEGMLRDVTEQVEADQRVQASEQQFRSMAQNASDVIYRFRLRPTPGFDFLNDVAATVSGFPAEAFLADPSLIWDRMHPDDRERHRTHRADLALIEEPITVRWQHADGHWIWLEERITPALDEDGEIEAVHGIIRDISAQKHAEERLVAALDQERTAADRLRAVDELKNAFLQAVSHELRTPLTSVVGYTTTLQRHSGELSDAQVAMMLDRLVVNATKLQRLLTDLLDVDRLTEGRVRAVRAPTDLRELVQRVVADAEAPGRQVALDLAEVVAEVDGPKVERIVENLLANAFKHTPEGTAVTVRLGPMEGGAHLVVEDHGPGIPVELREEIFQPFRQGPRSTTDSSPGTGIGLALVTRLAELHGGRAWVDDRPGGGSRFQVLLPGGGDHREAPVSTMGQADACDTAVSA